MLGDQVIADGSLRAAEGGVSFALRMPWYRALPLSCLESVEVRLDGEAFPPEALTLTLEGRPYRLSDLPPLHDTWWYVTDPIEVTLPRALTPGDGEHELDVTVALRIPYIVESGHPLVMRERCLKRMEVRP
ncbi:MAG: DUF6379 domain-containing protein [Thermoleophilia bacterium]|nr:DUF6379 domain-containing protein [Gaiellaceae bacterium]MDW8339359.1 DUF6379 domain-containing protein [Thermoleophilia bacterium]